MKENTSEEAAVRFKGLAIQGLILPYVVDILLILGFSPWIRIKAYEHSPKTWSSCSDIIIFGVWAALALSVLLPLPYVAGLIKAKTRTITRRTQQLIRSGGVAVAYAAIVAINGVMVFIVHMVLWTLIGGVW